MEVFAYQNILLNAQLLEDYWEGHFAILLLFDDQSLITKIQFSWFPNVYKHMIDAGKLESILLLVTCVLQIRVNQYFGSFETVEF